MAIGLPPSGPFRFLNPKISPVTAPPQTGLYNTTLTGVTRDANGNPLGNCTVTLYRALDNSVVDIIVSDGSGNFSFSLAPTSGTYYYRAVDLTNLLVGTTLSNLVGV